MHLSFSDYMTIVNLDTICIYQYFANIIFYEISIEQYNESARTGILSANTIV